MVLTEEQRQMIERKKQEAIRRHQQKCLLHSPGAPTSPIISSKKPPSQPPISDGKSTSSNIEKTLPQNVVINSCSSNIVKSDHIGVQEDVNKNRAEMNRQKALEKLNEKKKAAFKPEQTVLCQNITEQSIDIRLLVKSELWFNMAFDMKFGNVISEIVKDIKNRNYDARRKQWSFHIKDYKILVSVLGKHKNIKIKEEIPSTVVNILQSAHRTENKNLNKKVRMDKIGKQIVEKLMPFQVEGVRFGIRNEGRVLIADDMGLGKTIQAIALCDYYIDDWPVLVICPCSVKMSWQQQFLSWIPSLSEEDVNILHTSKDEIYDASITIVSCDMASKLSAEIAGRNFQIIIVDESHSLKNNQAARTKNLLPLIQVAKRAILLTGTPALSRPKELFTQISAIRRNLFKSYFKFAQRYCDAKEGRFGLEDNGCSNSDELNAVLKSTIMIRRMKYEVLDQLPSKMRQIIVLDPSLVEVSEDLQLHEKSFLSSKKEKRIALLQYYESTATAKKNGVVQFIMEKMESDQKMVVFAHHIAILDAIEKAASKKKIHSIRISGSTNAKSRQSYVDIFNTEPSCKLAILSLTAAGTGLNMTGSSLVVFAELYWNPGHLIQAEDRVYRIGQKQSVSVIYLLAKNTGDDYIWPMVKNKLNVLTNLGVGTKKGLDGATTSTQIKDNEGKQTMIEDFFAGLEDDDLFEHSAKRMKLSQET